MSFVPGDESNRLLDREFNPYLAPERTFEAAKNTGQRRHRTLFRWLAGLKLLAIIIGAVAALVDIESVMGTGPIISLLGISIATIAYRQRYWRGVWFGLSGVGITVSCFLLINVMNWGPGDAQVPVGSVAVVFALIAVPLGVVALVSPETTLVGVESRRDSE